jgi:hypothetical protein
MNLRRVRRPTSRAQGASSRPAARPSVEGSQGFEREVTGRRTQRKRMGRDAMSHDAAGAHHRSLSDCDPGADGGTVGNPDFVAHCDLAFEAFELDHRCEHAMAADGQHPGDIYHHAVVEEALLANGHPSPRVNGDPGRDHPSQKGHAAAHPQRSPIQDLQRAHYAHAPFKCRSAEQPQCPQAAYQPRHPQRRNPAASPRSSDDSVFHGSFTSGIGRGGLPTTHAPAGTRRLMTELGPIRAPACTCAPGNKIVRAPMMAPSSIHTLTGGGRKCRSPRNG